MKLCCDASLISAGENRNRMRIFILLYFLGLNISQATGKGSDNSTQMYYVKLTIDQNAIRNITEILKPFVRNTSLHVDDLQKTTICENNQTGAVCYCDTGYTWSDEVCKSNPECCSNITCTFPKSSSLMCVSNETVTVTGSITLNLNDYKHCLLDTNPQLYSDCNDKLLKKMKEEYSTLRGFDNLQINKYRRGSIIADFEVTIANQVNSQDLIRITENLGTNLSASFNLETSGFVRLQMPSKPVCYNSKQDLRCTVKEKLSTQPEWKLKSGNKEYDIHNGTESTVTINSMETSLTIKNISENWEGKYTCVYHQSSKSYTINHKASAVMDVFLLPDIDITTNPSFPQCKGSGGLLVTVKCETRKRKESYDVSWSPNPIRSLMPKNPGTPEEILAYAAEIYVSCDPPKPTFEVNCNFENKCNQSKKASVVINIIHENDRFCEAEGDWEVTKAGFTAVLKCKNGIGQRERECKNSSSEATWEPEVSRCVNRAVKDLLQEATVVDIGLGSLDGNAARVFSLLENVTDNVETIDTFSNLDTTVQVLDILSNKEKIRPNESASNNFLESSSNLLDESLQKSWKTKAEDSNISLASRYLSSVEKLIIASNITGVSNKKNLEVSVANCSQGSNCSNTVFNVSVVLESTDPGNVKTAGFKQLERYLPNNNDDQFEPNSIVVSTTTEGNQSDLHKIKINFQLLKERPPDTEIHCVFWDNDTQNWSKEGCEWEGPSKEGQCICKHLSSFAILMSRYPMTVPRIKEITYVGLSVSVISLVISLVIELIVWSTVVKTNTLYLRHTAHINISLCLLVADCCFLASAKPNMPEVWCRIIAVVMHFCYLAMFFWMLCLSSTLLHQAVFLFHNVSKKNYLTFSLVLGYVCPFLIVFITFVKCQSDTENDYFNKKTCWLVYKGFLKGSIYAFVIPAFIIVFVNVFFMLVVIMKLLDHPKNTGTSCDEEKKVAKTVIRSIIFLTPVFGVTWFFGFFVMLLDLTAGPSAFVVNYAFVLLNSFQGLFILIVTCLADKLTREALVTRFKKTAPASTTHSSITKLDSTSKK